MSDSKKDFKKQLESRKYRSNHIPAPEQKILEINGSLCGTLQNIVTFSGLPKAGKSTFLSACIASAFTQVPIFGMKLNLPHNRSAVAYFDTESSEYDFYRSMDKVKYAMQVSTLPANLHAYRFRDCNAAEIQQYVEFYLQQNKDCAVIFIDGLLDMLMNYNDEYESRTLINFLKKITAIYNVLLIGVVHLGKSTGNTLGAFGSMIDRYSQSVVTVEKDAKNDILDLKPKFLRSDKDFPTVSIQWADGGYQQIS